MLDKLLISFKDNISKNTRNPFLGTLVLIWIIRNWKIVYAIFFDNRKFEVRLQFIQDQISATTFYEIVGQFTINVGLAILTVIIIYLLLYITRYITNKFENQLLPWIYDISSEGKIVLKEKFDKLQSEKVILEERLEKERGKRIKAEAEVERLEEKEKQEIKNIEQPLFSDVERERDQPKSNKSKEKNIEKLNSESELMSINDFEDITNELSYDAIKDFFKRVISQEPILFKEESYLIDLFQHDYGFIMLKTMVDKSSNIYMLTDKGAKFFNIYLND